MPTRELADQIYRESLRLSAGRKLKICLLKKTTAASALANLVSNDLHASCWYFINDIVKFIYMLSFVILTKTPSLFSSSLFLSTRVRWIIGNRRFLHSRPAHLHAHATGVSDSSQSR